MKSQAHVINKPQKLQTNTTTFETWFYQVVCYGSRDLNYQDDASDEGENKENFFGLSLEQECGLDQSGSFPLLRH